MTTDEIKLFRLALGALVTKLREQREMTQAALAEKLGVLQPQIAKIERGSNGVPAEKYHVLARVFGMALDEFHNRVQAIVDATTRAAEAIRPGALTVVDARGLVRFVVEMKAR